MKNCLCLLFFCLLLCTACFTKPKEGEVATSVKTLRKDTLSPKILTKGYAPYDRIITMLYRYIDIKEEEGNFLWLEIFLHTCCSDYSVSASPQLRSTSADLYRSSVAVLDASINRHIHEGTIVPLRVDRERLEEWADYIVGESYNSIIDNIVIKIALAKRDGKSYKSDIDLFNSYFSDCLGYELRPTDSVERMNRAFNDARRMKKEEEIASLTRKMNKCLIDITELFVL